MNELMSIGQKEGIVTQQWTLVQRPKKMTMEKSLENFLKKLSTVNETVNTPKEGSIAILVD